MTTVSPSAMQITAISPWFGGKRTLAPAIVRQLGAHVAYWEPFCGSMAVLLAKNEAKLETVCDLHRNLTTLAMVLSVESQAVQLYDRLVRTLFCEDLLLRSRQWLLEHPDDQSVDTAYHFFIHSWAGRNGTAGSARMNFKIAVRYTPTGGSPTVRFRAAVDSIPAWHERLRNVVILNRDAFQIIPKIPDEPLTAIYADPPYFKTSRNGDGDGGYLHDFDEGVGFFTAGDDHHRLAEQLNSFKKTRVVVSYYAHPRLTELYPPARWTHIDHTMAKNLHVQNKRGSTKSEAPEVLIVNGPSYAEAAA